ncbi:MAG TPA: efflux RND transporter periplasmic adaptor subunit [Thermoanaerobaculia bacterium]
MKGERLFPKAAALLALGAIFLLAGCSKKAESAAKGGAGGRSRGQIEFPVEVAPVEARSVEYSVSAVGSVDAFERVEITARVPGAIERIHFSEGSVVGPGTLLVEIEPERYRLAVRSARATLEKAQAAEAEARTGLSRRESVNAKNPALVKEEDLDAWRTRVSTAKAEVAQARSAVDLAELNLREAFVRAPAAGVIQTRNVQTGQYVQPGVTLATLVRREPLLLRFQVPEQDASRLSPGMRARFRVRESARQYSALLTHVAASAESTSRMVAITARVDDPGRGDLRPGSFAQVEVPVGTSAESPVIPQTAVRPSERGFLAYVVEGDVARERELTLGLRTADGRVEVRSGVKPGEKLVIRGAEALQDGAKVRVTAGGERTGSSSFAGSGAAP